MRLGNMLCLTHEISDRIPLQQRRNAPKGSEREGERGRIDPSSLLRLRDGAATDLADVAGPGIVYPI